MTVSLFAIFLMANLHSPGREEVASSPTSPRVSSFSGEEAGPAEEEDAAADPAVPNPMNPLDPEEAAANSWALRALEEG